MPAPAATSAEEPAAEEPAASCGRPLGPGAEEGRINLLERGSSLSLWRILSLSLEDPLSLSGGSSLSFSGGSSLSLSLSLSGGSSLSLWRILSLFLWRILILSLSLWRIRINLSAGAEDGARQRGARRSSPRGPARPLPAAPPARRRAACGAWRRPCHGVRGGCVSWRFYHATPCHALPRPAMPSDALRGARPACLAPDTACLDA